jgi:serine/threonine protein kinase
MKLIYWKIIFFQIIFTLASIQKKYPDFRHNDLKANNIVLQISEKRSVNVSYNYEGQYFLVPDKGISVRLCDFDFATIPGIIDNKKLDNDWAREINAYPVRNRYYDIHYFFSSLIGFIPDLLEECPAEVSSFIENIVPIELREEPFVDKRKGKRIVKNSFKDKKGRVYQYPNEYCYPEKLLNHNLFDDFRAS